MYKEQGRRHVSVKVSSQFPQLWEICLWFNKMQPFSLWKDSSMSLEYYKVN